MYTIIKDKEREVKDFKVIKMFTLTVEHKYCGYTKTIEGNSIYDAMRKNGLDIKIWNVISIEKNN